MHWVAASAFKVAGATLKLSTVRMAKVGMPELL
jgi:hypothetical protein